MEPTLASKRDVVVRWRGLVGRGFCGRLRLRRNAGSTTAAQEPDSLGYNLGYVPFVAAFVVVGAAADAAFNEDLPTLGQILAAAFALLSPDYNVVPLRPLLPVTLAVNPHL